MRLRAPPKKRLRMKNTHTFGRGIYRELSTLKKISDSKSILKMFSLLLGCSWMNRLLSDIDISRSALIATFLELARSCCQVLVCALLSLLLYVLLRNLML